MENNICEFVEKAVVNLLYKEPLHAYLLMSMQRKYDSKFKASAGVSIRDMGIQLSINPEMFLKFTLDEASAVLVHECMHIYNKHHSRISDLDDKITEDKKLTFLAFNLAADVAINQYIPNIPKDSCTLEWFNKQFNTEAKPGETFEYYYEMIKKDVQDNPSKYEGMENDHDWGDSDGTSQEVKDQIVRDMVKNAQDKLSNEQVGNLPAHIKLALDALYHIPRDWRSDIRRFVAKQYAAKSKPTWTRRNRRYGVTQAGYKSDAKLSIVVGWDTSGSMSDEICAQVWSELRKLFDQGVELYVIECDCEVGAKYNFKKTMTPQCTGRGGTCFAPVFEEVAKSKRSFDGMLYFTDGGGPGNESIKDPPFPILWCLTDPFQDSAIPFTLPRYRQTTKVTVNKR